MGDFDTFWQLYPRKVAKLHAIKAYDKARKLASAEEILEGVQNYLAHLPDEMRFVAHPASWLNAGRWMDEYHEARPRQKPGAAEQYRGGNDDWFDECKRIHNGECELDRYRHARRKMLDEYKKGVA